MQLLNKIMKITSLQENKYLLPILLFGIFSVFFGLSNHSYTLDEVFSLYVSKDLIKMANIVWNEEANMWFYYLLLNFWQKLGSSEIVVRSLSASFAVGSILFIYKITKNLFNKNTAVISALLLVINFFFSVSAQYARGYSLLLFLVLASNYFFLKALKTGKYKVLYILTTILSIYTHFYAGFVLLAQILIIVTSKKLKSFRNSLLAISVFLLPILISPSFQSAQVNWISKPSILNLIGTAFALSGDFPPLLALYGLVFLYILVLTVKKYRKFNIQYLAYWLILPMLTAFLFSLFFKPIYKSVYFIVSLPPFVILTAYGIDKLTRKKLKALILVTFLVLSLLRLSLWYSKNTDYKWIFSNNDEDWRGATSYINESAKENDGIIFYGYYNQLPYEYYSHKDTPQIIELTKEPYSLGAGSELPEPDYELISELTNERLWLLLRDGDRGFLNRDKQLTEIQTNLEKIYREDFIKQFPGLKLILYEYER